MVLLTGPTLNRASKTLYLAQTSNRTGSPATFTANNPANNKNKNHNSTLPHSGAFVLLEL